MVPPPLSISMFSPTKSLRNDLSKTPHSILVTVRVLVFTAAYVLGKTSKMKA